MIGRIVPADNLEYLKKLDSGSVDLIYAAPPNSTGDFQQRLR
jgi:hypothetical protein